MIYRVLFPLLLVLLVAVFFLTKSPVIIFFSTALLLGYTLLRYRNDFFSPFFLGAVSLYIYLFWFPFFELYFGSVYQDHFRIQEIIKISAIAFLFYLLPSIFLPPKAGIRRGSGIDGDNRVDRILISNPIICGLAFWGLSAIVVGYLAAGLLIGGDQKTDLYIGFRSQVFYIWQTVSLLVILIAVFGAGHGFRGKFYTIVVLALLILFIFGERNFFFVPILFLASVLYNKNLINTAALSSLYIAGVLMLPVSQALKGAFVWGGWQPIRFSRLEEFYVGEFYAPGKNMYRLLAYDPYQSLEFLWLDLTRFLYMAPYSTNSWFARYVVETGGQGFSMVGFGWLTAGVPGVALLYTLSSLLLVFLYKNKDVSSTRTIVYAVALFSFAYSQRADLANWLAIWVKATWFPLVVFGLGVLFLAHGYSAGGNIRSHGGKAR